MPLVVASMSHLDSFVHHDIDTETPSSTSTQMQQPSQQQQQQQSIRSMFAGVISDAVMISVSSIWFTLCLIDVTVILYLTSSSPSSTDPTLLQGNTNRNDDNDNLEWMQVFVNSPQWTSIRVFLLIPLIIVRIVGVLKDVYDTVSTPELIYGKTDYFVMKRDLTLRRFLDTCDVIVIITSLYHYLVNLTLAMQSHLVALALAGFSVSILFSKILRRCNEVQRRIAKLEAANSAALRRNSLLAMSETDANGGSPTNKTKLKKQLSFNSKVSIHAEPVNGLPSPVTVVSEKTIFPPLENGFGHAESDFGPISRIESEGRPSPKPSAKRLQDLTLTTISDNDSNALRNPPLLPKESVEEPEQDESKQEEELRKRSKEEMGRLTMLMVGTVSMLASLTILNGLIQQSRRFR